MARVFLDANSLIGLLENRGKVSSDDLGDHDVLISTLSVHIYTYISKCKIPDKQLREVVDKFSIVEFTRNICYKLSRTESPRYYFKSLHEQAEYSQPSKVCIRSRIHPWIKNPRYSASEYKALDGPTSDFEDNVQLHSAANADSDIFLTSDKKLLKLKFFGKTQIASSFSTQTS